MTAGAPSGGRSGSSRGCRSRRRSPPPTGRSPRHGRRRRWTGSRRRPARPSCRCEEGVEVTAEVAQPLPVAADAVGPERTGRHVGPDQGGPSPNPTSGAGSGVSVVGAAVTGGAPDVSIPSDDSSRVMPSMSALERSSTTTTASTPVHARSPSRASHEGRELMVVIPRGGLAEPSAPGHRRPVGGEPAAPGRRRPASERAAVGGVDQRRSALLPPRRWRPARMSSSIAPQAAGRSFPVVQRHPVGGAGVHLPAAADDPDGDNGPWQ